MSQVTMCDFCGLTSRVAAEVRKFKVPRDAVPVGLSDVGGNEASLDVCVKCIALLKDVFGTFITGRRGSELDPAPAAAGPAVIEPVVEIQAVRDCDKDGHQFVRGLPCCIGCRQSWSPSLLEEL